jgi:phage tail sheath protein FI
MVTLVSPGVSVTVVDESAYGAPGAGTIPLLVIATEQDKVDPTGSETDGIALYTKSVRAGEVVRVTSQRELTQYFGNPQFTTSGSSVIQGSETSEYGLMAAYSYLGQGSQAFIVRANVDLSQLIATTTEPTSAISTANTWWFDTDETSYGIHEYSTTTGTWVVKTPVIEVNDNAVANEVSGLNSAGSGVFVPSTTVVNGTYLVVFHLNQTGDVSLQYFKGIGGSWEELDSDSTLSSGDTVTWARHFSVPASPGDGDVWIKTTSPGNGIDLVAHKYSTTVGNFVPVTVQGVTISLTAGASTSIGDFYPQDGSSSTALTSSTAVAGDLLLDLDVNTKGLILLQKVSTAKAPEALGNTVAKYAQVSQPSAVAADGQIWFDDTIDELDVYVVNSGAYDAVTPTYGTSAPTSPSTGDVWIDTTNAGFGQASERAYPVVKVYKGALGWITYDNTDQSTDRGVLFADITDTLGDATTLITGAPNPNIYPNGMIVINMAQSKNTVREYNATASAWRNAVSNHADGSGRFGRFAQRQYVVNAMQAVASGEDLRDPQYTFSLIAAPGYPELTDELVTLNSDRGETAFIIIDAPMRKNPTQVVQWAQNANVATENGEDGLVTNNTYSAVYYPAATTTEPLNGNTVVVPPSHVALYTYAYNDNISYVWFPPAGTTRGVVQNASAVGYLTTENEFKAISLTQGQRDAMYQNKLNPIATFVGNGTVIYGQKTLHTSTSALDRVNVARLVAYLRERFDALARPFLFEINDAQTRERAKLVFEKFLADILAKRGVYDYAVVCDESNNTPARIDRNELWIDVAIEPAKAVEFIYIPIRIVNTGTLATTA